MPNEKIYIEDTIVASASGEGSAGVNVIRVSGPDTEEIASIVDWLASDDSGFSTGADFSLNGGLHMG